MGFGRGSTQIPEQSAAIRQLGLRGSSMQFWPGGHWSPSWVAQGIKLGVGVAFEVLEVTLAVGLRVEVGVGVEHFCFRERRINNVHPQ